MNKKTDDLYYSTPAQEKFWGCLNEGDLNGMRESLMAGANPNVNQPGKQPALTLSAFPPWQGNAKNYRDSKRLSAADMVRLLLQYGANPKAQTKTISDQWVGGRSALFLLVINNEVEAVAEILKFGGNVNIAMEDYKNDGMKDDERIGTTALHVASKNHEGADMIALLLDHGADTDAQDGGGQTALDVAKLLHNTEIIQILQAHNDREILRENSALRMLENSDPASPNGPRSRKI